MERKLFLMLVTFAFLAIYGYLVVQVVAPFLRVLAWAAIIGILTRPVYSRLRSRLGENDLLAASLMTPAVVMVVVIPMVLLLLLLTQELTQMYRLLEGGALREQFHGLGALKDHPAWVPLRSALEPWLGQVDFNLQEMLIPAVQKATTFLAGYSTEILRNFFIFLLKLTVLVLALFFFYRDGNRLLQRFWSVVPLRTEDRQMLASRVESILSAVIFGIFLTSVVQGALGGIGFWLCDLPAPVLFGVLMAIGALIPMVGTVPIWLPASLYLFFQGELGKGIFLLCWGIFLVSSIDNLIKPMFISGRGKIPLLLVIIGVLGGLAAFGFLGVVLGPLLLALSAFFLDVYRAAWLPRHLLADVPDPGKPPADPPAPG